MGRLQLVAVRRHGGAISRIEREQRSAVTAATLCGAVLRNSSEQSGNLNRDILQILES